MKNLPNNITELPFISKELRKGDKKKLEIVFAAIECISTIGYENITYEALAKKLDTRRAHIAYYFKNKEDIFKACIQFINHTKKEILDEHLAEVNPSHSSNDYILKYVESPFIWGEKYPNYLSTMVLFYYLCTFNKKYFEVNTQIKESGQRKIISILKEKLDYKSSDSEIIFFAKNIQSLISGAMIDAIASGNISLAEAREQTKNQVKKMLEQMHF